MPESTCLHIQDHESGPIRVVDIPWISVRIGRAKFCEVRLTTDGLADEACRLYRRGRAWHLVPVGARGKIVVDGRPVEASCPLPFDVPFRVGPHCLTLRQDRSVDPDWHMYPGSLAADRTRSNPPSKEVRPDRTRATRTTPIVDSQRVVEASFKPAWRPHRSARENDSGPDPSAGVSVKDRWQSRWRAAEAELKARTDRGTVRTEAARPSFGAGFESVPLRETPVPSPQQKPTQGARPQRQDSPVARTLREDSPAPRADKPATRPDAEATPQPPTPAADAPMIEPGPVVTVEELEVSTIPTAGPATADDQPEPTTLDAAGNFELIDPVLAKSPITDPAVERVDELEEPPNAPAENGSWYELPVFAPVPQKRRESHRAGSRKRMAPARPSGDADRAEPRGNHDAQDADGARPAVLAAETGEDPRPFRANQSVPESSSKPPQMPSAKDILASHESRRRAQTASVAAKPNVSPLCPTQARQPDQWTLPAWVAGPPAAAVVLAVGMASGVLSWWWASDSRAVALMTERLITADQTGHRKPLPEFVTPAAGSWTQSTAEHLARWAIFMSFIEPGKEPSPGDVAALSSRALQISPLNPTARLTRAQLEKAGGDKPISPATLGLSRDAASLCWCARQLLAAGNKDEALSMYIKALAVLLPAEPFRGAIPRFCDDPDVPRYLLPGEERQRDILRELLANEPAFPGWSTAIPQNVATSLAAARLLKQRDRREADALLDFVINAPVAIEHDKPGGAAALAARAEAFALRSRWKEAEQNYRLAIDAADDERIKRSWWYNLADIELRLDDETQWQTALREALAVSTSDDISRRATEIQRAHGGRAVDRATSARAN